MKSGFWVSCLSWSDSLCRKENSENICWKKEGVYLYKKGHTPIHLKVLMTDSSKNNSLDYIKLLSKHVKYGSKKEIASFDETTRQAWQSYLQNVKNLENQ